MSDVYGNSLFLNSDAFAQNYNIDKLTKILKRPVVYPRYRISVLNPDETIDYIIPNEDIPIGGISFTENYQQGQRKSISLTLINVNKKYTPSVNKIWFNTRFRFDMGLQINSDQILWFAKGVYVLSDVSLTNANSNKTITYQLKDKFSIFEDKSGTLDAAYEIPVGDDALGVINGILNFDQGNGYILDYQKPFIHASFLGFKIQTTIRKESGDNLGSVLLEIATQMSAECYYNNVGNLCFFPIDETVADTQKPIIWTYENSGRDLHNMDLTYDNSDIVNTVKVNSSNVDYGIFTATVTNDNVSSPICVQRLGKRMPSPYSEANVWSDSTAKDLAIYYLRKSSIASVKFVCPVSFNPILTVNNLCEVENSFLNLQRDKLLISSISLTSDSGEMQVNFANTQDLPFN